MTKFCYFHSVLVIKVRLEISPQSCWWEVTPWLSLGPKSSLEPTMSSPEPWGELQTHSGGFGVWQEQYSPRALQLLQVGSVPLRALQEPQTQTCFQGTPNQPFPLRLCTPSPSHPPELAAMLGAASETGAGTDALSLSRQGPTGGGTRAQLTHRVNSSPECD